MKMMNKTSLALAVATALGVVSPQTFAIVKIASSTSTGYSALLLSNSTTNSAAGTPVQFAAEQSGEASLTLYSLYADLDRPIAGDLTAQVPVPANYGVTSTKPLTVRITLTGGATFANQPYLLCPISGATIANIVSAGVTGIMPADATLAQSALMVTAMSAGLVASAIGKSVATFNIPVGMGTHADGVCYVTMAPRGAAVSAVTAYNVGSRGVVDMTVDTTYVLGGVSTPISTAGTLLKFVTALKAEISPKDKAGGVVTATIDVKQASKKFEAGTQAVIGSIKITSANTNANIRVSSESAAGWNVTSILTTATVTINGNLVAGVQSVSLHNGVACNADQLYNGVPTTTTGGSSVSVTGIVVSDKITAGLSICATVDGTKTLDAGQLSAVLTGGGVSNFVPDLGSTTDIVKVSINGARLRVLNIPAVGATELATLRFYNTSSQNISVTGTLYGQDGKELGTPNAPLFPSLKSNDVEVLSTAALAQKFGISTPWVGRAWLMVQAQVDVGSFKVQALIRSANGTLINMSTDVTN
jgi:hypothetical protein